MSAKNVKWEWKKLGEVSEVIAGQSPKGSSYNNNEEGMEFHQGKKAFGNKVIGSSGVWTNEITKVAEPKDILISVRAPVGPVNFTDRKICIGRGLAVIRPQNIDSEYIYQFLVYNESKLNCKSGAVFDSISRDDIKNFEIPVPPIDEQKRIVKVLDETFEKIDAIKTTAETNLQNAKDLFLKSLDNIFAETNDSYNCEKLKSITNKIGSGSTPKGGKKSYLAEGISLIRSLNVHYGTFSYVDLAHINKAQAKALDGVTIEKDDVLFNITGASIARCCVVPNDVIPARVNQHVSILRPQKNVLDSRYLSLLLIAPSNQKTLIGIGEAGATRQALTKADLENFEIPLPPLPIQKQIVAKLDSLSEKVKQLESNYKQILADCDELKKATLKKAFEGNL